MHFKGSEKTLTFDDYIISASVTMTASNHQMLLQCHLHNFLSTYEIWWPILYMGKRRQTGSNLHVMGMKQAWQAGIQCIFPGPKKSWEAFRSPGQFLAKLAWAGKQDPRTEQIAVPAQKWRISHFAARMQPPIVLCHHPPIKCNV